MNNGWAIAFRIGEINTYWLFISDTVDSDSISSCDNFEILEGEDGPYIIICSIAALEVDM